MRFEAGLLTEAEVRGAVDVELDGPVRLLPPSIVNIGLLTRRDEVASWAHGRLQGVFVPTREETVAVSKPGHGVRPVAVWDLPSRLAYMALTSRLRPALPPVDRGRAQWRAFQRAPLQHDGGYVVASDIAACYQYVDHGLLAEELLVQTGDHAVVGTVTALLRETGGRTYGLPQQSDASDVLAEAFLARLDRALVRRGLLVARYNDDFRFTCATWSEAVRAIEVLAEESRLLGLTVNDLKTVTWRRKNYEDHLDEADRLRQEIADEAAMDLTQFDVDPYDGTLVEQPPEPDQVDRLGSVRVLERWASLLHNGTVAANRRAEHRAVVELLPSALRTLQTSPDTPPGTLRVCMRLLRLERTLTPAVAGYLTSRQDDAPVLSAFDGLLRSRAYLNGWQTWWLQQPLARLAGFADGTGSRARLRWERDALTSAEHTPVLRAHATHPLARHGEIGHEEILSIYDRSSSAVRPVLAASLALLGPPPEVRAAVTGDSAPCRWAYEWAEHFA